MCWESDYPHSDTIWPDAPASRPANSFHATLSQLRRAMREAAASGPLLPDLVIHHDSHYELNREVVSADLWRLQTALETRGIPGQRLATLSDVPELYNGDLAADLTATWLEAPREALRRDVLDAFSVLTHAIGDSDPERALTLLERARQLDPYNEAIYCDIARAQARLGQSDAVTRTLRLLTAALTEIDERPNPETVALCERLRSS